MNTTFVSWEAFHPNELRCIEINETELTLIYENDAELALAFSDSDQLDRFVSHLVTSLIHQDSQESIKWN